MEDEQLEQLLTSLGMSTDHQVRQAFIDKQLRPQPRPEPSPLDLSIPPPTFSNLKTPAPSFVGAGTQFAPRGAFPDMPLDPGNQVDPTMLQMGTMLSNVLADMIMRNQQSE